MRFDREALLLGAFVAVCLAPFLSLVIGSAFGFVDMRLLPHWLNTIAGVIALVGGFCMIRFRNVVRMLRHWQDDQEKG